MDPITKFFNRCPNSTEISYSDERCICISWSRKGRGFGEYTIFKDKEDGIWKLDSETDGKEAVKQAICDLIDSLELVD